MSEVCEWHVQQAVAKKRTGRSELMGGTSGMRLTTVGGRGGGRGGRSVGFNRDAKTGLLPRDNRKQIEGVTTYVLPSANKSARPMTGFGRENGGGLSAIAGFHASEAMGKRDKVDGKARAKRREQEELSLARQLGKDSGKSIGARYLIAAGKQPKAPVGDDADGDAGGPSKPRVFSPSTVRRIGFDPTRAEGSARAATNESAESKQTRVRRSKH